MVEKDSEYLEMFGIPDVDELTGCPGMAEGNPAFRLKVNLHDVEECLCMYGSPFRDRLLRRFGDEFTGLKSHQCSFMGF